MAGDLHTEQPLRAGHSRASGVVFGAAGLFAFDYSLELTSEAEFCISCHELRDDALAEFVGTSHHTNATGGGVPGLPRAQGARPEDDPEGPCGHRDLPHPAGTIATPEKHDEGLAREYHSEARSNGKTCISCHEGLAHELPPGVRPDDTLEEIGS